MRAARGPGRVEAAVGSEGRGLRTVSPRGLRGLGMHDVVVGTRVGGGERREMGLGGGGLVRVPAAVVIAGRDLNRQMGIGVGFGSQLQLVAKVGGNRPL